jgi:ABC-type Fe3+/spermidine/putrescine transport system ATPase subunit
MLEVRGITHSFDYTPVLRGIDLNVNRGEIMCLLGPSGCGKTTLLRVIAGLEHPDSGEVMVEDQRMASVPVHARDFGLVFQDFALFPHLNVAKNVMFGLRMQGHPAKKQRERTREVLEMVGLAGFEGRDVTELSGGERQRVALARSLAPNPRLLMLDEPLGSLDASLRDRLAVELRAIIKRVGLTAIYVTHDQQEAYAIADRIAVMNTGRIEQVDTPEELYRCPRSVFVARFLGLTNILPVNGYEDDAAHTPIGVFPVLDDSPAEAILIHPDRMRVVVASGSGRLSGNVTEKVFQGDVYRLRVEVAPRIVFSLKVSPRDGSVPEVGEEIALDFPDEAVIPLY